MQSLANLTSKRGLAICTRSLTRHYASEAPVKASVKLIAEIRKRVAGTSLVKAREALQATNNNLESALEWLEKDLTTLGAARAAKLSGRTTGEGLIALAVLSQGGWKRGVRAAMIELNCETDFVARNSIFAALAKDISYAAAFLTEPTPSDGPLFRDVPVASLADAPLVSLESQTRMSEAIQNGIAKLGEKISLRRVCTLVCDPLQDQTLGLAVSSYVHGSVAHADAASGSSPAVSLQAGRIGSLVGLGLSSRSIASFTSPSFDSNLDTVGRSLAMQLTGLNASSIRGNSLLEMGDPESTILYEQPFMMRSGAPTDESVGKVLRDWAAENSLLGEEVQGANEGLEVVEFQKWTVGEPVGGGSSTD